MAMYDCNTCITTTRIVAKSVPLYAESTHTYSAYYRGMFVVRDILRGCRKGACRDIVKTYSNRVITLQKG